MTTRARPGSDSSEPRPRLVFLDRDGVLNRMIVDAARGIVDSPLRPEEVELVAGVPAALRRLGELGFRLVIATNQPAAAKGKVTRAALEATHARVLALACAEGGRIERSEICFHRAEDRCPCRKPGAAMLARAHEALGAAAPGRCWMVGDRMTDVAAGSAFGARTALVGDDPGPPLPGVEPTLRVRDLVGFVDALVIVEGRGAVSSPSP